MNKCELCGVAVVVEVKGITHSYSLDPRIKEAMSVIHTVQNRLWADEATHEISLQLELSLKRLNELVLGGDGYYE